MAVVPLQKTCQKEVTRWRLLRCELNRYGVTRSSRDGDTELLLPASRPGWDPQVHLIQSRNGSDSLVGDLRGESQIGRAHV